MVRHAFGRCVMASLLALAGGAPGAETGKPKNPGFEADANKDGVPDGWAKGGSLQKIRVDTTEKKEGNSSVRLDAEKPADGGLWQDVPVEPGALYRLTVWVRTEKLGAGRSGALLATLSVGTKSGQTSLESAKSHAGTTAWVQEGLDFLGPKDGVAKLSCVFSKGGGVTGTVWFDGLELVRVAPAGGLGGLREPPTGWRPRAEWALQRQPQDWATLVAALDDFYTKATSQDPGGTESYIGALCAAAQGDPKARSCAERFYARNALRMRRGDLARPEARSLLEGALAPNEQDPELPLWAGMGLARAVALYGEEATPAAIDLIGRTLGHRLAQRRRVAATLSQDARELAQSGPGEKHIRVLDILLSITPPEASSRADIEVERMSALAAVGQADKARAAAEALVAPGRTVSDRSYYDALVTLVRAAAEAGNGEEAAKWIGVGREQFARTPDGGAGFLLACARALYERQRYDEAAAECQKLVACFPQAVRECFEAQKVLVSCLVRQDQGERAAGAAKVLYGAAGNSKEAITDAVKLAMAALKAKHRAIGPANAFAAFQKYGPNGQDGKRGTEDDVADPFADVRWAPPPEADALFSKTLDALPRSLGGLRARGYLYLYWGKPVQAMAEFARRYEQMPPDHSAASESVDDLLVALKACHGHTLAGGQLLEYLKLGPKGKDGKAGTNDDLSDPIADILKGK
ncbi:MAG TPA: hypothetical protein VM031_02535 [Phycisphaerae bacterium]|nr:hypothetical protein [Phycisphaerae bacterium]